MIPKKEVRIIMKIQDIETLAASVMEHAVDAGEVAGINLLVLVHGSPVLSLQSGYADLEQKIPMAPDTIMRLYSMSKPITAAAVMLLMERGLVDLNDPVSRYLPTFCNQTFVKEDALVPAVRQMTVHDLLFMTSGLSYGSESAAGQATLDVFSDMDRRLLGASPMSTREFADRIGSNPLEFEPSSSFAYGVSADILGALVEVISGKSFADFLQEEFFIPLEMADTGFWVPAEKRARLSTVYQKSENGFQRYTGNHLGIINAMDRLPAFQSGGAGLASTLEDYSHFAAMLLAGGNYKGRQLLQPETVRYFTQGSLQPWQQETLSRNWGGLEGYSYGNLMRVMKEPSRAIMYTTPGEYGWDGWLGPYFSNHPDCGITFLSGLQLTDAGTTPVVRKLRNTILTRLQTER